MKKTLHIDEQLLREAKTASGARTDTDTVRLGLEAPVRHAAYQRLRALRGSEPRGQPGSAATRAPIDSQALCRMIVLVDTSVWIRFLSDRPPYSTQLEETRSVATTSFTASC